MRDPLSLELYAQHKRDEYLQATECADEGGGAPRPLPRTLIRGWPGRPRHLPASGQGRGLPLNTQR
jgi:hypothetical protein